MPPLDLHAGLRLWNGLHALADYPVVAAVLRRETGTMASRLEGGALHYGFGLATPEELAAMDESERALMDALAASHGRVVGAKSYAPT